jgi:hypothetical protein
LALSGTTSRGYVKDRIMRRKRRREDFSADFENCNFT